MPESEVVNPNPTGPENIGGEVTEGSTAGELKPMNDKEGFLYNLLHEDFESIKPRTFMEALLYFMAGGDPANVNSSFLTPSTREEAFLFALFAKYLTAHTLPEDATGVIENPGSKNNQ